MTNIEELEQAITLEGFELQSVRFYKRLCFLVTAFLYPLLIAEWFRSIVGLSSPVEAIIVSVVFSSLVAYGLHRLNQELLVRRRRCHTQTQLTILLNPSIQIRVYDYERKRLETSLAILHQVVFYATIGFALVSVVSFVLGGHEQLDAPFLVAALWSLTLYARIRKIPEIA